MTKSNTLKAIMYRFFDFYCAENQVALIEARDYDSIYIYQENIMKTLSVDFDENDNTESGGIIHNMKEVGKQYKRDVQRSYGIDNCDKIDKTKIREDEINIIFSHLFDYFEQYFDAYDLLQSYLKKHKLESMLIEFNNCLSHIVMALLDNNMVVNLGRARTHLYRATLDAYKEIIIIESKENNAITKESDQKALFEIRQREINLIGSSKSQNSVIEDYTIFCKNVLSLSLEE